MPSVSAKLKAQLETIAEIEKASSLRYIFSSKRRHLIAEMEKAIHLFPHRKPKDWVNWHKTHEKLDHLLKKEKDSEYERREMRELWIKMLDKMQKALPALHPSQDASQPQLPLDASNHSDLNQSVQNNENPPSYSESQRRHQQSQSQQQQPNYDQQSHHPQQQNHPHHPPQFPLNPVTCLEFKAKLVRETIDTLCKSSGEFGRAADLSLMLYHDTKSIQDLEQSIHFYDMAKKPIKARDALKAAAANFIKEHCYGEAAHCLQSAIDIFENDHTKYRKYKVRDLALQRWLCELMQEPDLKVVRQQFLESRNHTEMVEHEEECHAFSDLLESIMNNDDMVRGHFEDMRKRCTRFGQDSDRFLELVNDLDERYGGWSTLELMKRGIGEGGDDADELVSEDLR